MNIILISPYSSVHSFGIRTLASCLRRDDHHVKILFLPKHFKTPYEEEELDQVIEHSREATLIGLSVMTNYFDNAVQITQRLRRSLPIPIVWGGIHPTLRPEECLDYADIVCIGEGEETVVELARRMQDGQDYSSVEGTWLNSSTGIVKNRIRPLIQNLNLVPFPDYDCERHYILDDKCVTQMTEHLLLKYTQGNYVTLPTRGCTFGCSYCSNNALNKMHPDQKPFRKRKIDNLLEELVQIKNKLSMINQIYLDDDAFLMYSIEEIRDFSVRYKREIALPLIVTGATPSTLTREKLSLLVDAGLRFIRMGIQTGSERTKRLYRRNYSNQQVIEAAKIMNAFRDRIGAPQYDIIVDNPWETHEDLVDTLMFLTELPAPYNLFLLSLTFYPGTELYEKAKKEGKITDDLEEIYRKDFNNFKPSYYNRLLLLLNESQGKITKEMMFLLTNRTLGRLGLNWLTYATVLLKIRNPSSKLYSMLYPVRALVNFALEIRRRMMH